LGEYEPVPGFGGEKAAENGWALAMATGREPPFSPSGLGAGRRTDRASVPGYSGDGGQRRDDRDPWRYEDFGRRSQRDTRGKRVRASSSKAAGRLAETQRQVPAGTVSSARLPGLMGAIPIGSETNALDVLGESGRPPSRWKDFWIIPLDKYLRVASVDRIADLVPRRSRKAHFKNEGRSYLSDAVAALVIGGTLAALVIFTAITGVPVEI